ncbi:acyl-CoA thioesterase [Bradyrhizobium sp. CB82]|uniref:acyl-CoA thioesterase n=1 Tax=Bradyrhizobium sp. CB82 TaxID=3039159 RepID=UPI0024B1FA2B|nr:acyl-CoA thioesterase [Bradyrhizobium sp. CB82]WFU41528.1 acyl-CoA thioesterase [Bradyrhizobium sp. CB82]
MFETAFTVEWGDCDEAGIVFYPNYFYWFDCAYQRWLRKLGLGQRELRRRFNGVTPLVDVGARFVKPVRYDDELVIYAETTAWGQRRFQVDYRLSVGNVEVASGFEQRAWRTLPIQASSAVGTCRPSSGQCSSEADVEGRERT